MTHRASAGGASARTAVIGVVALVMVLWTMAALFTLIYWSGLGLWIAGAVALVGFIWILKVYLRPRVSAADT